MTDSMDRAVQDAALPIAQHEFGHYVLAKLLGFRVGEVHLKFTYLKDHSAGSAIDPATELQSKGDIFTYIENRAFVLYAGSLAQTLRAGKVDNEEAVRIIKTTGSTDHAKVQELIHLLRSITCPFSADREVLQNQLNALESRIWNKAAAMVESEHATIVGLAQILAQRIRSGVKVTLSPEELAELSPLKDKFPE